jgi:tRNA threonylcarbamoyladenosine biosynthesis protein TsaE
MDIGIDEYLESDNYCLIEWGERIRSMLPPHNKVNLSINEDQSRTINIVII